MKLTQIRTLCSKSREFLAFRRRNMTTPLHCSRVEGYCLEPTYPFMGDIGMRYQLFPLVKWLHHSVAPHLTLNTIGQKGPTH